MLVVERALAGLPILLLVTNAQEGALQGFVSLYTITTESVKEPSQQERPWSKLCQISMPTCVKLPTRLFMAYLGFSKQIAGPHNTVKTTRLTEDARERLGRVSQWLDGVG